LFVATAIGVASLFATAAAARGASDAGVSKALFVATTTQMLFTGICAVVVMFHVSRTTKAVLRALDLYRR
jgi:glucose uptake protein GlcU